MRQEVDHALVEALVLVGALHAALFCTGGVQPVVDEPENVDRLGRCLDHSAQVGAACACKPVRTPAFELKLCAAQTRSIMHVPDRPRAAARCHDVYS